MSKNDILANEVFKVKFDRIGSSVLVIERESNFHGHVSKRLVLDLAHCSFFRKHDVPEVCSN